MSNLLNVSLLERARTAEAEAAEEDAGGGQGSLQLHDAVSARLQRDTLEQSGKLRREVANLFKPVDLDQVRSFRDKKCTKLSVTCVAVTPCGKRALTGSKDGGLLMWSLDDGAKLFKVPAVRRSKDGHNKGGAKDGRDSATQENNEGHSSIINAVAISSDGKFAVR